jgi:hypothetical protein
VEDRPVIGEAISSGGGITRRFRAGRVCREPGCSTRLSIYNDGDRCSIHEPMSAPRTRGRKIA